MAHIAANEISSANYTETFIHSFIGGLQHQSV